MFETLAHERIPFPVQAVEVTEKNFDELAQWTNGEIVNVPAKPNQAAKKYIKIDVENPQNEEQTHAHVGDVILVAERGGFKVYTMKAFRRSFRVVEGAKPKKMSIVVKATAIEIKDALESPVLKNNHDHELDAGCGPGCPVFEARVAVDREKTNA